MGSAQGGEPFVLRARAAPQGPSPAGPRARWALLRRLASLAFLASALILPVALTASPAFAQESPPPAPAPTPSPAPGPDLGGALQDFGSQLLGQLGGVLQQALTDWFTNSGPGLFGKLLATAFGAVAEVLWWLAGGVLGAGSGVGGANVFTQLPPGWSYDLAPVVAMRARLLPLAGAVLALALVLGVLWAGLGTVLGRPFGQLLNTVPMYLLASAGLVAAPALTRWWIDLVNAASAALL
ncbi:MAG: hypothetical protein ACRDJN_31330, partial [Chloroflexota bacterium]